MNLYEKITASDSKQLRFYSRIMTILRYSLLTVRDVPKKEITEFPTEIFYRKQNTSASMNASQGGKCETPGVSTPLVLQHNPLILHWYPTSTLLVLPWKKNTSGAPPE